MKILAVYHHPDFYDCFTVYFDFIEKTVNGKHFYMCLGMSSNPFHPQGFCQHSSGQLGRHNGHKITFESLPTDCQKAVTYDLKTE